jgi:hypothetical protein
MLAQLAAVALVSCVWLLTLALVFLCAAFASWWLGVDAAEDGHLQRWDRQNAA